MAGGYTHLTLLRSAIRQATNKVYTQPHPFEPWERRLADVLEMWGRYAFLGSVSPDYPYLGLDPDWADLMHKGKANVLIGHAIASIHAECNGSPDSVGWQQRFAWILGFVTHVIADVVIHPVVNIKVGKYEEHKEDHRRCEMTQDVWIYREIVGLDLHFSDHMKGEIRGCGRPFDLDDGVEELWADCLQKTYGRRPGGDQIDMWHASFLKLVDFAEAGRKIPVFGRHLVAGAAAYPDKSELNEEFLFDLKVPTDKAVDAQEQPVSFTETRSFADIYKKALSHVDELWSALGRDLFTGPSLGRECLQIIGDWSLDTGIDNASRNLRLWPWDERLAPVQR